VLLQLSIALVLAHFNVTSNFFFDYADSLLLLSGENLNFLDFSQFRVENLSPFVLVLSEVTILNYYILALLGAPDFVFELLFLSSLPLHELDYHSFSFLLLQLYHKLLLLPDQPPSAFFPH
jgi:hypothetical protein